MKTIVCNPRTLQAFRDRMAARPGATYPPDEALTTWEGVPIRTSVYCPEFLPVEPVAWWRRFFLRQKPKKPKRAVWVLDQPSPSDWKVWQSPS